MKKRSRSILSTILLLLTGTLVVLSLNTLSVLNSEIKSKFEGKRWSLPAIVYARPLELYTGLSLGSEMLIRELNLAGYRSENPVNSPGGYYRNGNTLRLITRSFTFPSGMEPSQDIIIRFSGNRISRISMAGSGEELPFLRLAPARIGSIHPLVHEDRLVLKPHEIPTLLTQGLMAVEDKGFHAHHGVSPTGIFRALVANIKAGRAVQGGSTLTQQLVKNLFLSRERTISRKAREAVMALLLEYNYSKEDILTAYINEVFLGQDGNRAIHGFGLASQFFFRRDVSDLSTAQIATLIGMVKGPSYYDPRKHAEQCLNRRNIVLKLMLDDNIITESQYALSLAEPLTDVSPQKNGFNRFPAFLDLVRKQLKSEYKEEDLKTNGLKILTTLDPQLQWKLEEQTSAAMTPLKQKSGEALQAAAIITGRESGEVLAMVGGADNVQSGFNRALDASRPVGSLVKPAIYLAAFARGYTLASVINDTALTIEHQGTSWKPENYDRMEHGPVPLFTALAQSYNLAAVRLGIDLGLQNVISTINRLGYSDTIQPYPSLLLGALEMSPLQVTQLYQTFGSGGFYQPLRAISSVMDQNDATLTRYGIEVEQRFSAEHIYLLNHALERVLTEGTGSRIGLSPALGLAGKTGTSNDLRDSWFAGYSDNYLGVVWLGRDDNQPISLTGSSGALKVWAAVMKATHPGLAHQPEPSGITWAQIDRETSTLTSSLNQNSTLLPFIAGTEPQQTGLIPGVDMRSIENSTRRFFDSINNIFR